jgi:hypothetical protein
MSAQTGLANGPEARLRRHQRDHARPHRPRHGLLTPAYLELERTRRTWARLSSSRSLRGIDEHLHGARLVKSFESILDQPTQADRLHPLVHRIVASP